MQALTVKEMEGRPSRKRKAEQGEVNRDEPNQDTGTERGDERDPTDTESTRKERGSEEWSK